MVMASPQFVSGSDGIGMPQHDGVLAVRTGRDHVDGRADHLLNALQVGARVGGQGIPGGDAKGGLRPAGEGFVDGLASDDLVGIQRQDVDQLAIQFVADADLDLGQAIQHIELGQAQAGDAVDDGGTLQRSRVQPAAAARTTGDRAPLLPDGGQVVADGAGHLPVELGREGAGADARRVGLGDAEHVVQHLRPHAGARGGIAGNTVAGGDVGVGAVVDVQQRALRAFEQDVLAGQVGLVDHVADVGQHRLDGLGHLHRLLEDRLEGQLFALQKAFEREVVQVQQLAQLLGETLGVLQVLGTQRAAGDLVLVGRADALAGGADLAAAAAFPQRLARLVHGHVERQDQRAGFADEQTRPHLHAGGFEALDLGQQMGRIDDHAVADVAGHAVAHDAAGDELQRGLDALDDQGMAGVVAALEARHALGVIGHPVHDLALALVTPLGADDDHIASARGLAVHLVCLHCLRRGKVRPRPYSARTTQSVCSRTSSRSQSNSSASCSWPGSTQTTVSPCSRKARTACRNAASSPQGARTAARKGAAGTRPTRVFRSRLKPTAGRRRPNTAPTSS
mmetsp:Transcript_23197/g.54782  ORF Transcript_23197/g.54782 Transcript_23197/m.54782 type:complete len:566 (+) Transcript_23197:2995-4692(+)